jgi:hypothetical protein
MQHRRQRRHLVCRSPQGRRGPEGVGEESSLGRVGVNSSLGLETGRSSCRRASREGVAVERGAGPLAAGGLGVCRGWSRGEGAAVRGCCPAASRARGRERRSCCRCGEGCRPRRSGRRDDRRVRLDLTFGIGQVHGDSDRDGSCPSQPGDGRKGLSGRLAGKVDKLPGKRGKFENKTGEIEFERMSG